MNHDKLKSDALICAYLCRQTDSHMDTESRAYSIPYLSSIAYLYPSKTGWSEIVYLWCPYFSNSCYFL